MELSHKQQTMVKVLATREQIQEVNETLELARDEARWIIFNKAKRVLDRLERQEMELLELHSLLA